MLIRATIACLLMAIFSLGYTQQNEVYFPYFELINLEDNGELQYSSSRLLKTYVEANNEYFIVLPPHDRVTSQSPKTIDESLNEASGQNSEYLLMAEIHNLEGSFIISAAVYNVATQQKVWSDLIKGMTSEDLDPLLSRLGRVFMTNSAARDDIEIGEVSSYEQQGIELQQIQANHYFGIMVGGNAILGERTLSGFGAAYSFDASTVIFNVNFDYYFSSNSLAQEEINTERMELGSFNLGVLYPLSRKRMTWFLSGGMDYSFLDIYAEGNRPDRSSTGGVGILAGGGYLLNRNSTVNFRIQTQLYFPTYQMESGYHPGVRFGVTTSFAR